MEVEYNDIRWWNYIEILIVFGVIDKEVWKYIIKIKSEFEKLLVDKDFNDVKGL